MPSKLPSFFVIGVQKAGTTTLHECLAQEGTICLPKLKETQFFSRDDKYAYGIDWYIAQFPDCPENSIRGEVCPDYIFWEKVPGRIRELIPNPKIIAVFRNPLDRAYSHYLMSVRRGHERLSFIEALIAEEGRLAGGDEEALRHLSYMERGKYFDQLQRYLEVFPESIFLFVKFEDLFNEETSADLYAGLLEFLGISTPPKILPLKIKANPASASRIKYISELIHRKSLMKTIVSKLIPSKRIRLRIGLVVDRLNRTPTQKKSIEEYNDIPERIVEFFNNETRKLEDLTKMDLSDWIINNQ